MGHSITLNLPDKAWQDLLPSGRDRNQAPEAVAEQLLADIVADPLLRLSGCFESDITDLAERHDHYIGEGVLDPHE